VAVVTFDGDQSGGKRALSADAVACAACAHAFGFVRTTARSCVPRMRIESADALVADCAPSSPFLNFNSTVVLSLFLPVVSSLLGRLVGKMYWHKYFFLPFSLLDVP
jgi:hypothetical protein